MTTPEAALATFEDARKQFVDAMIDVPDAALTHISSGDDYALGGLVTHVNAVLRRYGRVLDGIVAAPAAEFQAKSIDADMESENAQSAAGLTAATRGAAMAALAERHDHVVAGLTGVGAGDWSRKTAVLFGGSDGQAYPTGADDICTWLTGHYLEHVPHVAELLTGWRAGTAGGGGGD